MSRTNDPKSSCLTAQTHSTTHTHLHIPPFLHNPMFTPPPSPGLPPTTYAAEKQPELTVPDDRKQRAGRRVKWAAIVIPAILVLITISTRYITHPSGFDLFTGAPGATVQGWHYQHELQRRQQSSAPASSGSASASASGSTSAPASSASSTGTPTSQSPSVPSVPASPPVIPTPFPQPWDVSLGQNFSTTSCFQFFTNMTNTLPFRACRPFSLLQLSSTAFTQAQSNLTLLNSIVWGTCETTIPEDQCVANMSWFAQGLKSACAKDLEEGNANAVDALEGLQAYKLMRTAGCAVDPNTNTYCYINAVHNTNPSDVYYYNLPLGLSMPKTAVPTCSSCTRNLMSIFSEGLQSGQELAALRRSYQAASEATSRSCGASFSKAPGNGARSSSSSHGLLLLTAFFAVVMSLR